LRTTACLDHFQTLTDEKLGGQSTAYLKHSAEEGRPEGCLVFEGVFDSQVPANAPAVVRRLGQASFGSKVRAPQDAMMENKFAA
jgi:hypothetical protein